jgi:hypothetical protein
MKLGWRTSSYTGNGGGNCVEVGDRARMILVRDTKDRTGPVLRFTPAAWRGFAERVKRSLASLLVPAWRRLRRTGLIGMFLRRARGGSTRVSARQRAVSVCAGGGAVYESVVAAQRALRPGRREGSGRTGNRALGVPVSPGTLQASASSGRATAFRLADSGAMMTARMSSRVVRGCVVLVRRGYRSMVASMVSLRAGRMVAELVCSRLADPG